MDLGYEIEDWTPNRDCNAMLARGVESCIGRTGTLNWNAVGNGEFVFVISRIGITGVTDSDLLTNELELEGFVLGALEDSPWDLLEW
nr:hypothetical protein [Halapricum hydrolyticum]